METDWRLFTTLVRFDAVYAIHFKCSLSGSPTTRTCGRTCATCTSGRACAETVRFDEIRRHYYCTHPQINPSGLVAVLPDEDFDEPHGRERL